MLAELRTCGEGEFANFLRVCESAFGRGVTEQDIARWGRVVDNDRLLGAFEQGKLVGTTAAYPLTVTVPGGSVSAAGVTMVGLLPSHRRRGVFKQLMNRLLRDAHERGEPIAVLWAAEGGIYPQFGFGLGSKNARIVIERSRAAFREPVEPVGHARMLALDEARTFLPPIYDRVRVETPGMLVRSPDWWDAYRLDDPEHERGGGGPLHCCVTALGDHDEAYALYRTHPVYEHRLHHDWLEVVEVLATSPAATHEIWRHLLSLDLVERVRADFLPEDHPLMLMLAEPGQLRLTLCDGLWLRLIDVEKALGTRSYAGYGSIVLEVADSICSWNAGRWSIEASPEGAHVERSQAEPDLRLDVDDLAPAYLGAFTFTDLLHAGRVEELRSGAAVRASLLFLRNRAPWCAEVI